MSTHSGHTKKSASLTIRLTKEIKEKLDILARQTNRTRSFLAGEAIAAFLDQETSIIEGTERGLTDKAAGRVVAHDKAMARVRQTIEKAVAKPADAPDEQPK